jgi:hypothetical protein
MNISCSKCVKLGHLARECRGGDWRSGKPPSRPHGSEKTFETRKDEGAGPSKCYNPKPAVEIPTKIGMEFSS